MKEHPWISYPPLIRPQPTSALGGPEMPTLFASVPPPNSRASLGIINK